MSEFPLDTAPAPGGAPRTRDEILVAYPEAARQSRLTVLVRLILAIPHLIALYALGIAAGAVLIISWFAALILGRLPQGLAEFLAGFQRWNARVYAYLLLLTDKYPPFALEDTDYPVRVSFAPGRLNRLAVLFRFVLFWLAGAITGLLAYGLFPVIVLVAWPTALIAGRLPKPLHQAIAASHRYVTRSNGYMYLVTATYPWGLFGDAATAGGPGVGAPVGAPGESAHPAPSGGLSQPGQPPGSWQPPAQGQPGYGGPGYGGQPGYAGQPGYGQPGHAGQSELGSQPGYGQPGHAGQPGYGQPGHAGQSEIGSQPGHGQPGYAGQAGYVGEPGYAAQPGYAGGHPATPAGAPGWPTADPRIWRLVISEGAQKLVGLFLVLGGVLIAAVIGLVIIYAPGSNQILVRQNALTAVVSAHTRLTQQLRSFEVKTAGCRTSPQPEVCVTGQDQKASEDFGEFATSLRDIQMPSAGTDAANRLYSDAILTQQIFGRLAQSTSLSQYEQTIKSSGLTSVVAEFDKDYRSLVRVLAAP